MTASTSQALGTVHVIEPPETVPKSPAATMWERFTRLPLAARAYAWCVLVPTLLAALYWGLMAADVYTAEVRFAIRTAGSAGGSSLLDQFLGTGSPGSTSEDAEIVRDYILSREMLAVLDAELGLRTHYSSTAADWFARMDENASEEAYLEYYRAQVDVHIDESAHITTLEVDAFEPEIAQQMAATLLRAGEQLVNRMSATIAEDTLAIARQELASAENRVRAATLALTTYRTRSRSVNPGEETSAVLQIVTQLEGQLASARAELAQARSFMRRDSAQVRGLRARVDALETQVARERGRLASEGDSDLTQVIFGYEPLALDQKLAEQQYTSTLASLEAARVEAQRKQRYLIAFVRPTLPDEAQKPKRGWNIFLVFIITSIAFGIVALTWSAIKEQARL